MLVAISALTGVMAYIVLVGFFYEVNIFLSTEQQDREMSAVFWPASLVIVQARVLIWLAEKALLPVGIFLAGLGRSLIRRRDPLLPKARVLKDGE